jgi:hypothetical protein
MLARRLDRRQTLSIQCSLVIRVQVLGKHSLGREDSHSKQEEA